MFTVHQILALAASPDGYDNAALKMQTIITNALAQNTREEPTIQQLEEVAELWNEVLDKTLTRDDVEIILSFSKKAYVTLALNGIDDTDAHGQVMDALSGFVLNCPWPKHGDNVDLTIYLALLRHQFNQLKFF